HAHGRGLARRGDGRRDAGRPAAQDEVGAPPRAGGPPWRRGDLLPEPHDEGHRPPSARLEDRRRVRSAGRGAPPRRRGAAGRLMALFGSKVDKSKELRANRLRRLDEPSAELSPRRLMGAFSSLSAAATIAASALL